MTDWLLSTLHFILVFALVAILTAQHVLIKSGMTASALRQAAWLDRVYGGVALLLLTAGGGRVFYGSRAASFYVDNPLFWTKFGIFFAVALLSIPPTIQLARWSKQVNMNGGPLPSNAAIGRVRLWLAAEAGLLVLIPFIAAAVARGYGLS